MRDRRTQARNSPPRREMINQQLDEHTYRIKQLLKADITILQEENALLKTKCKKLAELQEKVQLVLRQNNQLLGQNQKMSRLLHQHKSENDILKSKFDQVANQRIGLISDFQFKQKKLLGEIENLNVQVQEIQGLKNMQINEIKAQCQLDIQNIKKQHASALQVYEAQIRKLKQMLDKRQYEIGQLTNRLKKQYSQAEYELMRGKQEREKLRNELAYMDADHKKDIDDLKYRLDANYLEQIQQLKRAHLENLEILQKQNFKIKDSLDRQLSENDSLRNEMNKNLSYFESNIGLLKRQNDNLKLQLIELQKISEHEKADIENDLSHFHKKQLFQVKQVHENHLKKLQNSIIGLQNVNLTKDNQIEQLMREKATARNLFDNESARLKQQIQAYRQKISQLDTMYSNRVKSLQGKVQEKQKQAAYVDSLYRQMKANSDSQIGSLKQLLGQKKIQIQKQKIVSKQSQQAALQDRNTLQNEKQTLKEALKREEKEKQIIRENLETQINQTEGSLRNRIEQLISKINMIQKQNQTLKKSIQQKDKQLKSVRDRLSESDQRQSKLQSQISDYRQKLLLKDKKNTELLQQQKQRLEKAHSYVLQNSKGDHQALLRLEAAKQKELRQKLAKKDRQLQTLLKHHRKMSEQVKALTQQQANKKNIDLKLPGATADLIATKNMFDVFLKTKVLDICGDVLDSKENLPES